MRFCLSLLLMACGSMSASEIGFFAPPYQRWKNEDQAKRLTDLSIAQPPRALADRRTPGKWKIIPYATASFSGKALVTGPETDAPQVEVPLKTGGWHAVYVGLSNVGRGGSATDDGVFARLAGETGWRRIRNTLPLADLRREVVEDVYLTVANLTEHSSIQFKQMPFNNGAIMSVKLVPLTPAEVVLFQGFISRNPFRSMIATFDAHSMIWANKPKNAEDLRTPFNGLDESDFGKWWYQIGGADLTHYPTKVGTVMGSRTTDFTRWEDREYAESLQTLIAANVHALKEAREIAQAQKAEFHVLVRPAAWLSSIPWEENFESAFAAEHPEWRCVDRDGTPTLYLSFAYPEVRRQIVEVLRESLEFQPDGVGILFHRGVPLILWEEGFIAAYKQKHGRDPRNVPEDDPTIGQMRGEILTKLLREIRNMLDETARKQNRATPYKVSLSTFSTEADNKKYGLELGQWVKEGLVTGDIAPAYFSHNASAAPVEMGYYKRLLAGTTVGLYPMFRGLKPGIPLEFLRKQVQAYADGADGIAVWDPAEAYTWGTKLAKQPMGQPGDFLRFLGHRALLEKWLEDGGVPPPQIHPLTVFGDNHYSRWFPGSGF